MRSLLRTTVFTTLAVLICVISYAAPIPTDVVPDNIEFAVLKKMYDSLGGSAWTNKTNWPLAGTWPASATSAQFGTWYGITVTNGDITKIVLPNNKLTGQIPSTIGNLKALTYLYLYENQLSGPIPASLSSINSLERLYLYSNSLIGSIPAGLGSLANLQYLLLHYNSLTGGIPSSLGNLSNLRYLQLNNNQLSGTIPPVLGNVTSLIELVLAANKLSGTIPSSLSKLSNLTNLNLHTNQLSGSIPSSLGNLSKLQSLTLYNNKLTGEIPFSIGSLTNLSYLYLHQNQLTDAIPNSLGNLVNLQYFYLSENKLTGSLPASLGSLTKVRYFYVHTNQLTGSIPTEFSNMTQMRVFYIYNNGFSGTIPSNLMSNWTSMTLLSLYDNQFSGAFPFIGNCKALTSFAVGKNSFTSIPDDILTLPLLASANFDPNELTSIPNFANQVNKANLTLAIRNNRLDFSVLEPLIGAGIKSLYISPQKNVHDVSNITPVLNSPFTIPSRNPGQYSTITWERQQPNGSWTSVTSQNEDATLKTYTRSSFTANDEGVYRWKMTNTKVTGHTLQSDPITVKTAQRLVLDNWAFQYKYDGRKRMTQKKVPGADWVYMVYDNRDRLVLTQDGEQRKLNQWLFTKYDVLNRPVMTGIFDTTAVLDQSKMQAVINTHYAKTSAKWGEVSGTTIHGYTNQTYPLQTDEDRYLTVTYYDDYAFKSLFNAPAFNYKAGEVSDQDETFDRVKGQVTGTKTKILGTPTWLKTINYYDDHYRVLQQIAENAAGGYDVVTSRYDFVGKVMNTKTSHYGNSQPVTWINLVNVQQQNDVLSNTTAAPWGSGASSAQILPANTDGWAEFTVSKLTPYLMFGLSDQDVNASYTSIDYAVYVYSSILKIYQNSGQVYTSASGTIKVGDVLRVERAGKTIFYSINGTKVYTSIVPSTSQLIVDNSFYDIGGQISKARVSHTFTTYSQPSRTIARRFDYDHAGRLLKTWHKIDAQSEVLLTKNEYNELGQLVDKKLYSTEPATTADEQRKFKQSVDYRYNIRGWLTSINNSELANKPATNDDDGDLFGMELGYNKPIGTGNTAWYNGNISAIKWSNSLGLGGVKENAYNYDYDTLNRIASADFRQKKSSWGLPEYKDDEGNTHTTDAFNETNYGYDLNGNLQKLTRKGVNGHNMDVLTYDYGTNTSRSNKLLSVSDTGDKLQGFIDGNIRGDDYQYDNNGSLIADNNKGITAITYNHLNLPDKVTKSTGDYIKYTYDATGRKLGQQVFNNLNARKKKTDYAGEYFYENDTLKFINHEEGRVVINQPAAQTNVTPEYQYHLKDHLGNVRLTFTTKEDTIKSLATLETANESDEQNQFLYYNEAVKINSDLFDHTNDGGSNPPGGTGTNPGGDPDATLGYAMRLTGTNSERYGLAKSLSVMPGDVVKMEVFAKYLEGNSVNWTQALQDFMISIATGGNAPEGTIIDAGAPGSIGTAVFPYTGLLSRTDDNGAGPKAYLNWLVFDRDFNYKDGGFRRLSSTPREQGQDVAHEHLAYDLTIKEPGYVYIYLSNESETSVEVFFDDFKIEHVKGPVVQMEDYYPFGLAFNSYSRENSTPNMYQYNGKEKQDELGLDWLDYGARMYMAEIGRWAVIDPAVEKFFPLSGYTYVANNPVLLNDPTGEDWTITMTEDRDGRREYNVTFTAAVLNSSKNKSINMASLAIGLMEQTKALFDQEVAREDGTLDFNVNFQAEIRVIGDKKDLSETEHLIEVKDSDHEDFKSDRRGEIVAGRANNGKEISLNESWVKYITSGVDNTTGTHEIGHTGGLRHPKHDQNYYLWGLLRIGDGPTANSPAGNFMNQGWISTPTGPTKEQMARMYRLYKSGELNRKDNVPIKVN